MLFRGGTNAALKLRPFPHVSILGRLYEAALKRRTHPAEMTLLVDSE
jgi:hypothetical protein